MVWLVDNLAVGVEAQNIIANTARPGDDDWNQESPHNKKTFEVFKQKVLLRNRIKVLTEFFLKV